MTFQSAKTRSLNDFHGQRPLAWWCENKVTEWFPWAAAAGLMVQNKGRWMISMGSCRWPDGMPHSFLAWGAIRHALRAQHWKIWLCFLLKVRGFSYSQEWLLRLHCLNCVIIVAWFVGISDISLVGHDVKTHANLATRMKQIRNLQASNFQRKWGLFH